LFNFRKWLDGFIGLALIGWIAFGIADLGGKQHMADISCGKCHLLDPTASPEQARKLVAAQEVLCRGCHANALQMSHPSGFVPSMKLPAEYPADWKGTLTCSTCHAIHSTAPGRLRGNKRGAALCLSCHEPGFFEQMKDRGNSLRQTGHLGMAGTPGSQVDAQSLQCIGCHENRTDALGVRIGGNNIVYHSSGAANHPIGVRYPANPGRNVNLRSRSMLPKVILLPDGKTGCVSCHQVYKKEHGKLVMPNENSALCLQCHTL